MKSIAIGELSRRAAVKVPTIRSMRDGGCCRRRTERKATAGPMGRPMCKSSVSSGMPESSASRSRTSVPCSTWPNILTHPAREPDAIARKHLAVIDDKIARLTGLRQEMQAMLEQCSGGDVRECRIIEVLADHGECFSDRH